MFTFHKPKVFRSINGCCICKAKSSSSRFTDSHKYEYCFMKCFALDEIRSGEICNACVLLVKRFLKLPKDSKKNWNHVVDARSGPGIKNMVKNKNKNKKNKSKDNDCSLNESPIKRKHIYKPKNKRKALKSTIRKRDPNEQISGFLCEGYWTRKEVCCGVIFVGLSGEVTIDAKYFSPCQFHNKTAKAEPGMEMDTDASNEDSCGSSNDSHLTAANKLAAVCSAALDEEATKNVKSMLGGDFDEGFFDKPAISPSSEDSVSSSPPPIEDTLDEEEVDDDETSSLSKGLDLSNALRPTALLA